MAITRRRDAHSALLSLYITNLGNLQPVFPEIKFATATATRCGVGLAPDSATSPTGWSYVCAPTSPRRLPARTPAPPLRCWTGEWHGVGWALVAPSLLRGAAEPRVDGLIAGDAAAVSTNTRVEMMCLNCNEIAAFLVSPSPLSELATAS